MAGTSNPIRDKRIIRKKLQGKTVSDIAKSEGMSNTGTFSALKRLQPQLLIALRKADYDLNKAVGKMVEMADAPTTEFFAKDGKVTDQREVRDNATCLKARTQLLRLHGVLGTEFNSQPQAQSNMPHIMVIVGADDSRINRLKAQTITISQNDVLQPSWDGNGTASASVEPDDSK